MLAAKPLIKVLEKFKNFPDILLHRHVWEFLMKCIGKASRSYTFNIFLMKRKIRTKKQLYLKIKQKKLWIREGLKKT